MDYLDPRKNLKDQFMLMTGYVLIAVAVSMAAIIMVYQAYGFGIGKNGTVIQNGLTFFSSHPHPANIYVNGELKSVKTNTRLVLSEGIYQIRLSRAGYRDWQRSIELSGGKVQHYDYPFLFPKELVTKSIDSYTAAPGLSTQSPDRKWLVVQQPGSLERLKVYDLSKPAVKPTEINLAPSLLSAASKHHLQLVEWASDNKHLLLKHVYGTKTEFILIDRTSAAQAVNLNKELSISPDELTLRDKKYDLYYSYNKTAGKLETISLGSPVPVLLLDHVLAYKTYGRDTVLYATETDALKDKIIVNLKISNDTFPVKRLARNTAYTLDLAKYNGVMYVAAGSAKDNRVFIYKDPAGQLRKDPDHVAVASQVLRVEGVSYLSFSPNAQFIVAENNNRFSVYDIQNEKGFNYKAELPLDKPQPHASWMDGDRLTYVSGGKLVVFDYDYANVQTLVPASSGYLPAFDPDYKYVYALQPVTAGKLNLDQTALLTPADL